MSASEHDQGEAARPTDAPLATDRPKRTSPVPARELVHFDEQLVLWLRATPLGTDPAHAQPFVRRIRTRVEVAGGELLPASGSAVGALFDALELPDAIELALGLLADAQLEAAEARVSAAIALGPIDRTADAPSGAAIDRAQHLAHHAFAYELLLDDEATRQADATHLFSRVTITDPLRGHAIDAQFPTKRECRDAIEHLKRAALPSAARESHARLLSLLSAQHAARISISSLQPHVALERLSRVRDELSDVVLLHASRDAAGVVPLGALVVALRRARRELLALGVELSLRSALDQLELGQALAREQAVALLSALLASINALGYRPLFVLERAHELDPPSLQVIELALDQHAGPHLLVATIEEGGSLPAALSLEPPFEHVSLEPLDDEARLEVAGQVLGLPGTDPAARHIAHLGGDSIAAIEEAARLVVSSGDVVFDRGVMRFRTDAARMPYSSRIDALVARRAAGLSPAALRVLEALAIAPLASDEPLVARIAELDGLRPEAVTTGLAQLEREGFRRPHAQLHPLGLVIRQAVRAAMPPSRAAELHRFVARLLLESAPASPSFQHALIGYHLAEGGRERDAARALLDCAGVASHRGFERAAVRLAALALKLDGADDTRARASEIAERAGRPASEPLYDTQTGAGAEQGSAASAQAPRTRVSLAPTGSVAKDALRGAIAALASSDAETAERMLDTAVAAGIERAPAGRLWALAQLAKGDVPGAVRALKRVRATRASGREALTAALILLEAQAPIDAVRSGLEALASARRGGEHKGELAALHVLAACYRALDREADAQRLEARADEMTSA